MLCQHCKPNQATPHYKQTVNGQTTELHLCPVCATKLTGSGTFSGLFSNPFSVFDSGFALSGGRTCPTCGLTESELRRTGRVGCGACYDHFADI
ncbi:MAG: hypothetical protein IJ042_00780, partial [Butyricicoccus sp.]|nr:hypothetical protein [Butyricicoccus sp.]